MLDVCFLIRFHVEVYNDPPEQHIGLYSDGVAYYPTWWYDDELASADVFVAWRYTASVALAPSAQARVVWLQVWACARRVYLSLEQHKSWSRHTSALSSTNYGHVMYTSALSSMNQYVLSSCAG